MPGKERILKRYLLLISAVFSLCIAGIFLATATRNANLMQEQLLTSARSHFTAIVVTRNWSAQHGGVYVIKRPGVASTPYLNDPDVVTTEGLVLTLKNPALMTREISDIAGENDLFSFHITSMKPLNPNNAPDLFETQALQSFEQGQEESFLMEDKAEGARLRYMAPLMVEQSCLACHAKQGYAVGQVRGGISVSFSIDEMNRAIRQSYQVILALTLVTLGLLLFSLWLVFRRMQQRLDVAQAQLREMATVDALTGVANRGSIMERFSEDFAKQRRLGGALGCLMIDVDFFKSVNDSFGHQKGDEVLKELASIISGSLRPYDTFGRYGGEEFLMVLEGESADRLAAVAERSRALVEEQLSAQCDLPKPLTISLGGALVLASDKCIDDVIQRADRALYRAKEQGRNRAVLILEEEPGPAGASPC
ncbi:diguanylate cyclase [Desulfovibrio ferrophilus]|uniref:diguanylate cyclase n=1 Tax=Desulfovibrio ferrophilus TaxID=241368 RepID=A0A2Z6B1X2_9BACT|nr:diguanylate cyclase [Desulfovibrio ferrophilus]BBD09494.1 response regulator PleD [Desulfovibrio ferrophilus]